MPASGTETWSAIAGTVSSAVALFGLSAIWYQVRAGRLTLKASVDAQVYTRLDTINQILIDKPYLEAELEKSYNLATNEARAAKNLADMFFTLFEQIHRQKSTYQAPSLFKTSSTMTSEQWDAWELTIMNAMSFPFVAGYWTSDAHKRYESRFAGDMTQLLKRPEYRQLVATRPSFTTAADVTTSTH